VPDFRRSQHRRNAKQRDQPFLVREQGLTINSVFDVISISKIFTHLDIASGGSQLLAWYLGSI
jgi:hypothetical protein